MIDFTTIVAVDDEHAEELRLVWPTWRLHRPEMLERPLLLICDGRRSRSDWESRLSFVDHPRRRIQCWSMPRVSQREKMLTSLVHGPSLVDTPWYLKLDTDVVAVAPGEWLRDDWFAPDEQSRTPVFVSSPWGYTKPADAIQRLDDWADGIPALRDQPRLELAPNPGWTRVCHRRVISWCFFGDTAWTREMWSCCEGRLPVPSQDTFLWFCAARTRRLYRRVFMKAFGWRHITRRKTLIELCAEAVRAAPPSPGQKEATK